ncbi:MutS-related protein [Actinokineospora sp. G85]|uniref:MutS-related protein n=1 Tax=Actinokineospora sp. G85 TaxID=3406626 RepID=UPI003C7148DE
MPSLLGEPVAGDRSGCFSDLNLDQVAAAVTRADPTLADYLRHLPDPGLIGYRQRLFQDLERPDVLAAARGFTRSMAETRARLARIDGMTHPPSAGRWFLAAVTEHQRAVVAFADGLAPAASEALRGVRDAVRELVRSSGFTRLAEEAARVRGSLAGVRYDLLLHADTVSAGPAADTRADYAARVVALFDRFRHEAVPVRRPGRPVGVGLDAVEEGVLDLVARLHPEVFAEVDAFARRHRGFVAEGLALLDRELRFCLGYLDFLAPIRAAGMPVCYPEVTGGPGLDARGAYDLALAAKAAARGERVVGNNLLLGDGERVLVVSGPNQGGKTTFARAFGQLHHLAALGLPVPAAAARVAVVDRVLTHFERAEEQGASKLEEELLRLRALLAEAGPRSAVVLNEIFTSTTADDAAELSRRVLAELDAVGAAVCWVSFIGDLARWSPAAVSMVSDPDRSFAVTRRAADGRGHALDIVRRHGLTRDQVLRRLAR